MILLCWYGTEVNILYCCRVTFFTGSLGVARYFVQGSNSKVASMLSLTMLANSSCYNKEYSLTYLRRTFRSYWRKGQVFASIEVKQVKMLQFCWQWSQNIHQVNTMKIQNSLPYVRCFGYAAKMVSQWTLSFSLHSHVNEICQILLAEHFETIASKIAEFYLFDPVKPKTWPLTFSSISTKRYVVNRSNYTFSESL